MAQVDLVTVATVTLTDAQIKALPTTGITVVAAPGAGKMTRVLGCTMIADAMAGAYTNIDAAATLGLSHGVTALAEASVSDVSDLLTDTGDVVVANLATTTGITDVDLITNAAVTVTLDNGESGNLTGGNAANTLQVAVAYHVLEV